MLAAETAAVIMVGMEENGPQTASMATTPTGCEHASAAPSPTERSSSSSERGGHTSIAAHLLPQAIAALGKK
jgi:hypothetical protein